MALEAQCQLPKSKCRQQKWREFPASNLTSLENFWKHSTFLQYGTTILVGLEEQVYNLAVTTLLSPSFTETFQMMRTLIEGRRCPPARGLQYIPRSSQIMKIDSNWSENEVLELKLRLNGSPGRSNFIGNPPDPLKPSIIPQNTKFR